jgi:peptidoglycan hydrolase-like protein with peptidoglycan-binding domain
LRLYTGLIDGIYGDGTRAGVRALQGSTGLEATGDIDDPTFQALQRRYGDEVLSVSATPASTDPTASSRTAGTSPPSSATGATATNPLRLRAGDDGPQVTRLQQRLADLGFRPGPADGHFGPATSSAVLAFQKHEGLDRDQIVGEQVWARLDQPAGAGPRSTAPGPRLEVDLDRQVAFFVAADGAVTVINVSTGSGETYDETDGTTSVAYTPTGDFTVYRRYDGLEHAPLGSLYRPAYFTAGWAVHGSPSVPAYPASHGCVRTADVDQDFLFPQLTTGTSVSIYGTSLGSPEDAAPGF